ncbi:hypothetical protein SSYM_2152 [Serratia symbiotica str. Tucson]|uniref:Uncharacterized protein n=1 Tax=Serratia symbiotica str. Tucson TaxID=914128 RepID=E9CNW0_9GAMM|nr:hypothetical protein SSYM_2152 [Serratia symbiotica str. Tucson]
MSNKTSCAMVPTIFQPFPMTTAIHPHSFCGYLMNQQQQGGKRQNVDHHQDEFPINRRNNLLFQYCYLSYPPEVKNATTWRGVLRILQNYERFIISKNSSLVLVIANLLMRNSIASISPIGWMILRSIHIFCNSSEVVSNSSLRVPERL